jgi:low affinity Fe/Cu permease
MLHGHCEAEPIERVEWRDGVPHGYAAGVSVKHPTERGSEGRTLFDRAAEAASNFSSSPAFFTVCGLLVAAWAASYVLVASDTVHHVLADAMAAVTLLLVALLKNAERRAEHAIQGKLDRLAEAMLAERGKHPDDGAEELEEAVGMHDEV